MARQRLTELMRRRILSAVPVEAAGGAFADPESLLQVSLRQHRVITLLMCGLGGALLLFSGWVLLFRLPEDDDGIAWFLVVLAGFLATYYGLLRIWAIGGLRLSRWSDAEARVCRVRLVDHDKEDEWGFTKWFDLTMVEVSMHEVTSAPTPDPLDTKLSTPPEYFARARISPPAHFGNEKFDGKLVLLASTREPRPLVAVSLVPKGRFYRCRDTPWAVLLRLVDRLFDRI